MKNLTFKGLGGEVVINTKDLRCFVDEVFDALVDVIGNLDADIPTAISVLKQSKRLKGYRMYDVNESSILGEPCILISFSYDDNLDVDFYCNRDEDMGEYYNHEYAYVHYVGNESKEGDVKRKTIMDIHISADDTDDISVYLGDF